MKVGERTWETPEGVKVHDVLRREGEVLIIDREVRCPHPLQFITVLVSLQTPGLNQGSSNDQFRKRGIGRRAPPQRPRDHKGDNSSDMKTTFKKLEIIGFQVLGLLARELNQEVRNCHDCQRIRPHLCPEHKAQREELDNFREIIIDKRIFEAHHSSGTTDGQKHYIKPSYYLRVEKPKRPKGRPRKTK